MNDVKELIERLRASGTASAPRNSDGVYMSICDEAADALERISAERDEAMALLDLIREEAEKDNAPLGRSDSLALANIRATLRSLTGGNGNE